MFIKYPVPGKKFEITAVLNLIPGKYGNRYVNVFLCLLLSITLKTCCTFIIMDLLSIYREKRGGKNKKQDPDVVSNDSMILFQNFD